MTDEQGIVPRQWRKPICDVRGIEARPLKDRGFRGHRLRPSFKTNVKIDKARSRGGAPPRPACGRLRGEALHESTSRRVPLTRLRQVASPRQARRFAPTSPRKRGEVFKRARGGAVVDISEDSQ